MTSSGQCIGCARYLSYGDDGPECGAFLNGIPEEIFTGLHDHTKAFPGDNGVRFLSIYDRDTLTEEELEAMFSRP